MVQFKLFLGFMMSIQVNIAYSATCVENGSYVQVDTPSKRLIIKYHPSGKVKEKGYQGYYSNKLISTGTYIGTWRTYNKNGVLIKSIYYYNDIPSKAFIEKKEYYPNGVVKSIKKFNNYELYESQVDSIGTWKYFNLTGKLIKQISYEHKKEPDN